MENLKQFTHLCGHAKGQSNKVQGQYREFLMLSVCVCVFLFMLVCVHLCIVVGRVRRLSA